MPTILTCVICGQDFSPQITQIAQRHGEFWVSLRRCSVDAVPGIGEWERHVIGFTPFTLADRLLHLLRVSSVFYAYRG